MNAEIFVNREEHFESESITGTDVTIGITHQGTNDKSISETETHSKALHGGKSNESKND